MSVELQTCDSRSYSILTRLNYLFSVGVLFHNFDRPLFSAIVLSCFLQVPFLFGIPVFERAASCVIHLIFRRTGRHLFLTDDEEGKPPLLKCMIEDQEDCYFMYVPSILVPLCVCLYIYMNLVYSQVSLGNLNMQYIE